MLTRQRVRENAFFLPESNENLPRMASPCKGCPNQTEFALSGSRLYPSLDAEAVRYDREFMHTVPEHRCHNAMDHICAGSGVTLYREGPVQNLVRIGYGQ